MKCLAFALALSTAGMPAIALAAEPQPVMVTPGDVIVSISFDQESDVDKQWIKFRKETAHEVEKGHLRVIPPRIANSGTRKNSQWANSTMSRAGLIGLPKEYVCQFRWKCNKTTDRKTLARGGVFIDLGHRCIRTNFTRTGTTLKLENHLVGKDAEESSIVLAETPELKLVDEKWYDIVVEVKGHEVVLQIDGHVLYGTHDLILKDRANTFNLDSGGAGYVLDKIEIREAGDYHPDWKTRREQLANDSKSPGR